MSRHDTGNGIIERHDVDPRGCVAVREPATHRRGHWTVNQALVGSAYSVGTGVGRDAVQTLDQDESSMPVWR